VFRSTDGGATWAATAVHGAAYGLTVVGAPPRVYVICQNHQTGAYIVCRSTDRGETWRPAGFEPDPSPIVVDPQNPGVLYASKTHSYGVKDGGIFKSTDGGVHWMPTGLLGFASVLPLAVDPGTSNVVYASTMAGLLRSTDRGKSWRAVYTGLPTGPVGQLVFDPVDSARMYASSGQLFGSADGGRGWTQLGEDLASGISAFAIDPVSATTFYAGTFNGVYVLRGADLATPTPTPTVDPRCVPDGLTFMPTAAPPGATVAMRGSCYFLHSGRHADVYFDAMRIGQVAGDTLGQYQLQFVVPTDASPGLHRVRVVGAQSTTFTVLRGTVTPTPTPVPTASDGSCPTQNISVVPGVGPA